MTGVVTCHNKLIGVNFIIKG